MCFQMQVDFETSSNSEVSKSNSWKITSLSKTTVLRGSRFSQCFILSTALHCLLYQVRFYAKKYFELLPIVSTAFNAKQGLRITLVSVKDVLLQLYLYKIKKRIRSCSIALRFEAKQGFTDNTDFLKTVQFFILFILLFLSCGYYFQLCIDPHSDHKK